MKIKHCNISSFPKDINKDGIQKSEGVSDFRRILESKKSVHLFINQLTLSLNNLSLSGLLEQPFY